MTTTQKILIFLLFPICSWAQPVKISEKEVKIQGAFIDGAMHQNLQQFDKAEKIYEEILQKDTKNAAANYELARVYGALKKHEKAIQNAKYAVDLDKANPWYKMLYADILTQFGKHKEAAELYEALVKQEPNNEYYYYEWAESLGAAGNKEKAVKTFEQLEKRIGIDEDICRQKHILFLELGETRKAEKELEKLVYNYPENIDFLHLLAGFYKQIGDKDKEIATYRRVLNIAPADGKATMAIAALSKSQNKDADYLASLKTVFLSKDIALDLKIKELIPFANKVSVSNDKSIADAAIDLIKVLDEIHPSEGKVAAIYGDFLYHTNRRTEALTQYEKTVKLSPSVYSVWEQIFYIQSDNKDFEALLKSTEAALEVFPNQANVVYFNGWAYSMKNNHQSAINSLEQVMIMAGKNNRLKLDAAILLSKSYFANNQANAAKTMLLKTLAFGGENDAQILENLGDAYSKTNDTENAVLYWQKAKIKGSKSTNLDKKIAERKL